MAAALLRRELQKHPIDVQVESFGLDALDGDGAAAHAVTVMKEYGYDLSGHQSRRLRSASEAHLILTMTANHKRRVLETFPDVADRLYTFKEYAAEDAEVGRVGRACVTEWQASQAGLGGGTVPGSTGNPDRITGLWSRLAEYDVPDPYGGSIETYRRCARELERTVRAIAQRIVSEFSGGERP